MHLLIAHGASGSAASMAGHVRGLKERGVAATAIDLPLRKAEKAVPVYRERMDEVAEPASRLVISGQSYGGRVASLVAAQPAALCAALVCFSYPLHRPGHPDWDERSRHWPGIKVPVLFLSGESDPFARIDLLRHAIEERAPSSRLVTYPKVGHGLKVVLDDVLDQVAAFVSELESGAPAS